MYIAESEERAIKEEGDTKQHKERPKGRECYANFCRTCETTTSKIETK